MNDLSRIFAAAKIGKLRQFVKNLTPEAREKFKELRKNVWWWRPGSKNFPKNFDFKPNNSLAFNYELVRREKRELCLQPFPSLSGLCRHLVPMLDDTPPDQWLYRAIELNAAKEKGWLSLPMEWNLKLPIAQLKEAFIGYILDGRKRDGIPEPKPNAKIRRKPQPWRWLELMDIADLGIHRLEESDQAAVRKARKRAKEKWLIFFNAITQPQKFPYKYEPIYEEDIDSDNKEESDFANFMASAPPAKTYYKLWRGIWPTEIINDGA